MKRELIACCGLDCENCEARRATVSNDPGLKEETARKWSAMNQAPEITAETIHCMGCRTEGAKFAYCGICEIRKCVHDRGFETCGECSESDHCPKVGAIFEHAPDAREQLRSLMTGL